MKAQVTHEVIGTTRFGDPEIMVTVLEPHPMAGFQLLLKSTASMDHKAQQVTDTGEVTYLVYGFAPRKGVADDWIGAFAAATLEDLMAKVAGYVDWIHQRNAIRDEVDSYALAKHVERFRESLWDVGNADYVELWGHVLAEVDRVTLALREAADDSD